MKKIMIIKCANKKMSNIAAYADNNKLKILSLTKEYPINTEFKGISEVTINEELVTFVFTDRESISNLIDVLTTIQTKLK